MPDHGVDLGVDLYKLLVVAKDDLPSISAIYADAVTQYNRARSGLDAPMQRPDHFGASPGPVHNAWAGLFDVAVKIFSDTQSSLDATAGALAKAVDMYAATDQAATTELNRLRQRLEPHPGK